MSTTITYNNSTIATIDGNGSKTLNCNGKLMEGEITVTETTLSSIKVLGTLQTDTVYATKDGVTKNATWVYFSEDSSYHHAISELDFGTWVVTDTREGRTVTSNVLIDTFGHYTTTITFIQPYLRMYSPYTFSMATTQRWNGTIEYSTNLSTWNTWDGTSISAASDGTNYNLYLRGINNTRVSHDSSSQSEWIITGTDASVRFTGSIENLLDYQTYSNGEHPTMDSQCFQALFGGGNPTILNTPELTPITLSNNCYQYMFADCTNLVEISELPATTLTSSCYLKMFAHTSITTAPELPATTLASFCYNQMFVGCTLLTTPPELPATTIASYCYAQMFFGCTKLTTLPKLPAAALAENCYYIMFKNCSNIKVSSTQTGDYQYAWRIPTSGTGTTATDWNKEMIASTGGTFTSYPSINTTYYTDHQPV